MFYVYEQNDRSDDDRIVAHYWSQGCKCEFCTPITNRMVAEQQYLIQSGMNGQACYSGTANERYGVKE
jgi:hypothetical protein